MIFRGCEYAYPLGITEHWDVGVTKCPEVLDQNKI